MKILYIIIPILLIVAFLIYGLHKYQESKKYKEFLEKIKDEERVLTFFWNNKEITEKQLINMYKNPDPSEKMNVKPPRPGDIIGYRRYSYGKIVEEKKYTIINKENKNGYICFKEWTNWKTNSDAPVMFIFVSLYELYYFDHENESERYRTPLVRHLL